MPDTKKDFWPPDIFADDVRTPSAILREQALLLGSKTRNLIMGEVQTEGGDDWFTIRFYLVAPVLDGYRYKVCVLRHDISLFPVYILQGLTERLQTEQNAGVEVRMSPVLIEEFYSIHRDSPPSNYRIESEADFVTWVESLLSSQEMRRVLKHLMALIRSNSVLPAIAS
jgi:hypothetical protein